MAYGDNRSSVASDTFDSSISASWDNGYGDFDPFVWATGGYINPSTALGESRCMIRNTGTYANNQYSTATVEALSASQYNQVGVGVRGAGGTNEAQYQFQVNSTDGGEGLSKYQLVVFGDAFASYTVLATSGTAGALSSGHTITIEAEGTTIRGGSNEGSGDTQRVTTTDATYSSGRPSVQAYANTTVANARLTAWVGGDITAPAGAVIPAASMYYRRLRTA